MEYLSKRKKITILIAIMVSLLFVSLNQTIVGTALPRIVADLGGMDLFDWVFTIFMLTSSVTAILVGKLSDLYGRKPFVLAGLTLFIAGSFLRDRRHHSPADPIPRTPGIRRRDDHVHGLHLRRGSVPPRGRGDAGRG